MNEEISTDNLIGFVIFDKEDYRDILENLNQVFIDVTRNPMSFDFLLCNRLNDADCSNEDFLCFTIHTGGKRKLGDRAEIIVTFDKLDIAKDILIDMDDVILTHKYIFEDKFCNNFHEYLKYIDRRENAAINNWHEQAYYEFSNAVWKKNLNNLTLARGAYSIATVIRQINPHETVQWGKIHKQFGIYFSLHIYDESFEPAKSEEITKLKFLEEVSPVQLFKEIIRLNKSEAI